MAKYRHKVHNLYPDRDYQLRLRAKVNGVTGPWSNFVKFRTALDEVAPGVVENLKLSYENGVLILSWDKPSVDAEGNPLLDFGGYEVKIVDDTTAREVKFNTYETRSEFTLNSLRWQLRDPLTDALEPLSGQYTFFVAAWDLAGNLGEAVSIEFGAEPPGPFNMLDWTGGNQSIVITWEESVDIDLSHYEIFRDNVFIGRTVGTELEFMDGNPGPGEHEYYAEAVDAFQLRTRSTNTLTGAKTYGYWQGDVSVPKPPSGLSFASVPSGAGLADVTVTFAAPVLNEDDSDYEDHSEFMVQWAKALDGPWQSTRIIDDRVNGTDAQQFSVGINGLQATTAYHFRAQAIDRYSNKSSWALGQHTTVADTTPPSRPAVPTAASNLLRVQVTHALQKHAGGVLEDDVRGLKVYIGTSNAFVTDATTYIGTLDIPGLEGFVATGSFPVESVTRRWVKVTAVDAAGNESEASPAVDAGAIQLISDLYVEQASITSASIGSLSVSKLIAGDGVVNNFDVKALLRVLNGGYIQSENFNANPANGELAGYRLSQQGLEIYSGTVAAPTLTINNSPNLIPWAYSSFEHDQLYFFGGTDSGGQTVASKLLYTANANTSLIVADGWEGERSLRFRSAAGTSSGAPAEILFTPATTTYQSVVEAGNKYLVSFYAKTTSPYSISLVARWQNSATTESVAAITIPNTASKWRRYFAVFTAPTGATGMYTGVRTTSPNVDVNLDAFQIEVVTTSVADSLLTPSAWKVPGQTSIDGAQITTGEIKSLNYNPATLAGWRIGLEGNLTAYNAFFHGNVNATGGYLSNLSVYNTLTVGGNGNSGLITASSGNWSLNGLGTLWAQNATIHGTVNATAGSFNGVTAEDIIVGRVSDNVGTIRSRDPYTSGSTGWIISNTGIGYGGGNYQVILRNAYIRGNLSASDISAGTLSGQYISGGEISGVVFKTLNTASSYPGMIQIGYVSNGFGYGGTMWFMHPSAGGNVSSAYSIGIYPIYDTFNRWAYGSTARTALNIPWIATTGLYASSYLGAYNIQTDSWIYSGGDVSGSSITSRGDATVPGSLYVDTIRPESGKSDIDFVGTLDLNGYAITSAGGISCNSIGTALAVTSTIGGVNFNNSNISSVSSISATSATIGGVSISNDDITSVDDIFTTSSTADLGSSSNPFNRVYTNTIYRNAEATFSSLEYKNVAKREPKVLDEIAQLDILLFAYKNDPEQSLRYGISYESASEYLRMYHPAEEKKGRKYREIKAVEVTSMVGLALGGVKELYAKVQQLEAELAKLKAKGN